MKKMFYAVAVIAAMAVCSCGNKAQTTETEMVEGEAIEIVKPDSTCCGHDHDACNPDSCTSATPCDKCKKAAE